MKMLIHITVIEKSPAIINPGKEKLAPYNIGNMKPPIKNRIVDTVSAYFRRFINDFFSFFLFSSAIYHPVII